MKMRKQDIPRAIHEGEIDLDGMKISCAILPGGIRVVSERSFTKALGRARPGGQTRARSRAAQSNGDFLPLLLVPANIQPAIPVGFWSGLRTETFEYRTAGTNALAAGIDARIVPAICKIWTRARRLKLLRRNQLATAERAEIIQEGLSEVGFDVLVDHACGYEPPRSVYRKSADDFFASAPRRYRPEFTHEYSAAIYGVFGWRYVEGQTKHPMMMGRIIAETIYAPMAPDMLVRLRSANPRNEQGRRSMKHLQLMSEEVGVPELKFRIAEVTGIAKTAAGNPRMFWFLFRRAFPQRGDQTEMAIAALPAECHEAEQKAPANDAQRATRRGRRKAG